MKQSYIGALALTGIVVGLVNLPSLDAQSPNTHRANQSPTPDYQTSTGGGAQSAELSGKMDNRRPQPLRNPLLNLKRAELDDTIARPLFAATRRPFIRKTSPQPPVRTHTPVKSKTFSYKLLGVIIGNENSTALIRDLTKGENIRVSEGDEVQGWRIGQVERHRISFKKKGTKALVLNLFSE